MWLLLLIPNEYDKNLIYSSDYEETEESLLVYYW